MFHLDNSLLSWLVYADYLDDNDQNGSIIRELVENPQTNQWHWESKFGIHKVGCPRGGSHDTNIVGANYLAYRDGAELFGSVGEPWV